MLNAELFPWSYTHTRSTFTLINQTTFPRVVAAYQLEKSHNQTLETVQRNFHEW